MALDFLVTNSDLHQRDTQKEKPLASRVGMNLGEKGGVGWRITGIAVAVQTAQWPIGGHGS